MVLALVSLVFAKFIRDLLTQKRRKILSFNRFIEENHAHMSLFTILVILAHLGFSIKRLDC
jgi:hypothetical protein